MKKRARIAFFLKKHYSAHFENLEYITNCLFKIAVIVNTSLYVMLKQELYDVKVLIERKYFGDSRKSIAFFKIQMYNMSNKCRNMSF